MSTFVNFVSILNTLAEIRERKLEAADKAMSVQSRRKIAFVAGHLQFTQFNVNVINVHLNNIETILIAY